MENLKTPVKSIAELGVSTLTNAFIEKYLLSDGKRPVVLLWDGFTDNVIIDRLIIQGIKNYINITTKYWMYTDTYDLILQDMSKANHVIFTYSLGAYNKRGESSLNLNECHSLLCRSEHEGIVKCHDPVTNVIYTRCIFDFIITTYKPSKLYVYCADMPVRIRKNNNKTKQKTKKKITNLNNINHNLYTY